MTQKEQPFRTVSIEREVIERAYRVVVISGNGPAAIGCWLGESKSE